MSEAVDTVVRSDDDRIAAEHIVSLLLAGSDKDSVLDRYFAYRASCSEIVWRQALAALLQEKS